MTCPKCGSKDIKTWYSGGRQKAACNDCLWHGLWESLKTKKKEEQ